MGLDLKKIKSLFVESEPKKGTEDLEPKNKESVNSSITSTNKNDKPDQTIIGALYKTLDEHNLPGEDYLEFIQALNAMKNLALDDSIKVQTVTATLSTKGLTVDKIKESADYYKKILENEKEQFVSELNSQIDKTIKSKEKIIETLKESIKIKSDQIANLTKEISDAEQNINLNNNLIKAAELKIQTAQDNFNSAYNAVIEQINDNLSKIK